MFTGLVKEATAALKVAVMQNRMRQPDGTASENTLKLTQIHKSQFHRLTINIVYLCVYFNNQIIEILTKSNER